MRGGGRGGQITSVRGREGEVARPMTYKCPKPKKPVGGGGAARMQRDRRNECGACSADQCKQWMTSFSNTVQEHINLKVG